MDGVNKMPTYDFPRPSVAVDIVVFAQDQEMEKSAFAWNVLLIKRGKDPFKDQWALPGGYVEENEGLQAAAIRELQEETGVKMTPERGVYQVGAYGDPGRDPRGHVVSIAYMTAINREIPVKGADDAKEAAWFCATELPALAFDHGEIISAAAGKLDEMYGLKENMNGLQPRILASIAVKKGK